MSILKAASRRSFIITLFFMFLLFASIDALFFLGHDTLLQWLQPSSRIETDVPELKNFLSQISETLGLLKTYILPVSAGFMILFTLLQWLFLRSSLARLLGKTGTASVSPKQKKSPAQASEKTDKREKTEHDRRMYLYLLSVLQREGRFLDFMAEDLDLFEDEQIGAAVRSVHQNCKKIIMKNLALEPVIDKEEGQEITIDPGFDPMTVKLTGNVTGEPPFKGLLRHKGWRAKKLELPTLTQGRDSRIIDPAEVEIL